MQEPFHWVFNFLVFTNTLLLASLQSQVVNNNNNNNDNNNNNTNMKLADRRTLSYRDVQGGPKK